MSATQPPPRLLLGATLLFWGGMTGRPFIGLVLALVVESRQWLRWRWDFDDAAFARAWQMGVLLAGGLMALLFIDGERANVMPTLITWLPALLLPSQLAQAFGLRPAVPLSALSFFAAKRRERNRRLGLEEREVMFHFGNAYFVAALLSAALGVWAEGKVFLPGLLVLCVWRFLAMPQRRAGAILMVFVAAGTLALAGQAGLNALYNWFSRGGHGGDSWSDSTHGHTAIGAMRNLKLSSDIQWRLRADGGTRPPVLLRRATFNRFRGVTWEIGRMMGGGSLEYEFSDLDTYEPEVGESYYLANPKLDSATATSREWPRFHLRGSVKPGGALPLPGSVTSFGGFDLDAAQRNPLATVRVYPASPVIDGVVLWQGGAEADAPPDDVFDIQVPRFEKEMLRRVVDAIGLEQAATTREKLALLQGWFTREFRYTLYLATDAPPQSLSEGTAIGRFLESTRRGHCEYFATSAALLLREAGVAARYNTGFAVLERDARRNEYVIRGVHGHAWCRVWIPEEQRWIDFDPTPADWLSLESQDGMGLGQRFADALKRMREDLFIWRSDPANRMLLLWIIAAPALIGGVWVGMRLWKSRHRTGVPARRLAGATGMPSALFELESAAVRHLGPRPPGMPFGEWLLTLSRSMHGAADVLHEAVALHQRLRFDPACPQDGVHDRVKSLARELRKAIPRKAAKSPGAA
jgi:transglutaminase-like putative cysteine protease